MTDKEKAIVDIESIKVFQKKAISDFSQYKTLVLERHDTGIVRLLIDDAKVNYLTLSMFEFHLLGGVQNAKKWFLHKQMQEDYEKALLFEQQAIKGVNKAVMKYRQGNTLCIWGDFKDFFTNGSLIRLMCQNAYTSAKVELEKIINL